MTRDLDHRIERIYLAQRRSTDNWEGPRVLSRRAEWISLSLRAEAASIRRGVSARHAARLQGGCHPSGTHERECQETFWKRRDRRDRIVADALDARAAFWAAVEQRAAHMKAEY